MTVAELIEALKRAPQSARVNVTYAGHDDRAATYVGLTSDRRTVCICDNGLDAPSSEIALFDEASEAAS